MKQPKVSNRRYGHLKISQIIILGVFILFLYALLPRLGDFRDSWGSLRQANITWLIVALSLSLVTYVAAAGVYVALSQKVLPLARTSLVQLASNFVNRLLPSGIGALGVNYAYLRRQKHSEAQASAVLVLNNLLGFIGNMLLLVGFVVSGSVRPHAVHWPQLSPLVYVGAGLVIIVIVFVLAATFTPRLIKGFRDFRKALQDYRQHPVKIVAALGASMSLTLLYTLCLYACTRAIGGAIALPALFVTMSLGVAGATAVPTPGGLGGAEAALVGGLVVYGLDGSTALAITLLYRIFTYWLPLLAGSVAFFISRRQRYI